jgi:hypothetical protein
MLQRDALGGRLRMLILLAAVVAPGLISRDGLAQASSGFSGTVTYTGNLGPVSGFRPICVCVYTDPNLAAGLGCIILSSNPAPYNIATFNTQTYYVVAFLDPDLNERLSPGEPYEIYHDRAAPPADPIVAGPTQTGIDFTFGDENVPGASPSLTPAATQSSTETPTPVPTDTPTPAFPTVTTTALPSAVPTATQTTRPRPCVGDCDASGEVMVNELIIMVNVALGTADVGACSAGDRDGNGTIDITEITAAVSNAVGGCSAT